MQSQLLLHDDAFHDQKSRRAAEIIFRTASTQSRLVDDLLDVSRAVTGRLAMQQQLVPLPYIVGDSIGAVSSDAKEKDVAIDLDLATESLIVQADPVRVRQIAWNLLTNAVKFTPSGGRVRVRVVRDGNEARLDVEDTGQGIDPELLPRIFSLDRPGEPRHLTRSQGGLGVGLALVHQLVQLHKGRIEVHSDGIGKGARLTVWLPLYEPAARADDPDRNKADGPPARPMALAGTQALVVDDDRDAVAALRELLMLEGAEVSIAHAGEGALALARTQRFDVVISDLAMPGMDGLAVMRAIRRTGRNAHTPAIAISGYNRSQDTDAAREAGFTEHLSKPVDLAQLVAVIRRVVAASKKPGNETR
jgi:two-component system CheB/CheR fusion protein